MAIPYPVVKSNTGQGPPLFCRKVYVAANGGLIGEIDRPYCADGARGTLRRLFVRKRLTGGLARKKASYEEKS